MSKLRLSGMGDEAGYDIQTQIKAHKELGWNYIDIRFVDGQNLTAVSDEKFEDVYKAVRESGLKVSSFASGICGRGRSTRHDFQLDIDDMKRAIPRMQRFETQYIRVMSCPYDPDEVQIPEAENKKEVFRRLGELAKMAEEGGIVMVHEQGGTGWTSSDPLKMRELIETIDSPALKLCFDMANFTGKDAGDQSWNAYQKVKDLIAYVHLKDRVDDTTTVIPGDGIIPVRKLVKQMAEDGYEWFLSMEPHVAVVHHLGKRVRTPPAVLYETYIEAGKRTAEIFSDEVGQIS